MHGEDRVGHWVPCTIYSSFYSLKAGFCTKPGTRLVASKPMILLFLHMVLELQESEVVPSFSQGLLGFEHLSLCLYSNAPTTQALSLA